MRDVISRPAPGIRIVPRYYGRKRGGVLDPREALWHARNLKGGRPGLGEGEGTSRDVRQRPKGGREVREARLGRVSSEFRLRRSFMKYPIYPEGRVKFLTGRGTSKGSSAALIDST